MSLTGRFSALFLGALAVALVVFSLSTHFAARIHLERRLTERMNDALDTLAAAAEIHPDGVEWEPGERLLTLGRGDGVEEPCWMILNDQGHPVDRSINWAEAGLQDDWSPDLAPGTRLTDHAGHPWMVSQRSIQAGRHGRTGSQAAAQKTSPPVMDPPSLFSPSMTIVVFAPLEPVRASLVSLDWFLLIVSLSVWLIAAFLARRLSRRALAPLRRLASSARGLDATDPGWSLAEAGTGDELEELGRAFNDLLGRLHGAYERQRSFTGNASHQLRTPLTGLIGQIEVALRKERTVDEYQRVLETARARAVQLGRITEAMLFLAQNESDAGTLGVELLELNSWTRSHIAGLLDSGDWSGLVQVAPCEHDLTIAVHPTLLTQLVDNLIDNARKYSGPNPRILVRTDSRDTWVCLAVEDTGPGISPSDAPRIFDPFYRSSKARGQGIPGAGLGLAVVHRIATVFGGRVEIHSTEAGGCRVEVLIPRTSTPITSVIAPDRLLHAGMNAPSRS